MKYKVGDHVIIKSDRNFDYKDNLEYAKQLFGKELIIRSISRSPNGWSCKMLPIDANDLNYPIYVDINSIQEKVLEIGDFVTIKSIRWYEDTSFHQTSSEVLGATFTNSMSKYCGKRAKIRSYKISPYNFYHVDYKLKGCDDYVYTNKMFKETNNMELKDLKSGMWIETRMGKKYLVMKDMEYGDKQEKLAFIRNGGFLVGSDYNEDMTFIQYNNFDIVAVYTPFYMYFL